MWVDFELNGLNLLCFKYEGLNFFFCVIVESVDERKGVEIKCLQLISVLFGKTIFMLVVLFLGREISYCFNNLYVKIYVEGFCFLFIGEVEFGDLQNWLEDFGFLIFVLESENRGVF